MIFLICYWIFLAYAFTLTSFEKLDVSAFMGLFDEIYTPTNMILAAGLLGICFALNGITKAIEHRKGEKQ